MKKTRIVKRTAPDNSVQYVIQQKHFLFRWTWTDAWINSLDGASCRDSFSTLEEAQENLVWFDGTKFKDEVQP
jgi:hypothetical protein